MTATATEPGTPLPAIVICCAEVLGEEFGALLASVESAAQRPRPGSPYLAEREEWEASSEHSQDLWSYGHRMARGILLNLADHLAMLRKAFSGPELPLYAHMTLSRVVAEAAAQVCNLIDPEAGYRERVLRAALLGLRSRTQEVRAIGSLLDEHPVRRIGALENTTRAREEFIGLMEKAGLEVRRRVGMPTGARYLGDGPFRDLDPKLTLLVNGLFPDRPAGYQIGSGVVHSLEWMLRDAIASDGADGVRAEPDLLGMGAATLLALDACAAVAGAYARLYGHDPAPAAEASARRCLRVDKACAAEFARVQLLRAAGR
ncbi:hypothetical protein DQ384_36610 [Sphaerisporangium album]|uniref:Uncharacterized protein n=1 Tax=Sphaerisporangium album TaxID=509200 RepID=A0A367EVF1_9ACTN|nr:hypothetical protein [Sphaerisporangium album]RCG21140.1 hypothetical protein DQ384_36610 [Sphaerisporangium album]